MGCGASIPGDNDVTGLASIPPENPSPKSKLYAVATDTEPDEVARAAAPSPQKTSQQLEQLQESSADEAAAGSASDEAAAPLSLMPTDEAGPLTRLFCSSAPIRQSRPYLGDARVRCRVEQAVLLSYCGHSNSCTHQ
jgi:hypothetical protein